MFCKLNITLENKSGLENENPDRGRKLYQSGLERS